MRCPFCGSEDTDVRDSRRAEEGGAVRRRRQCTKCVARFTTFERVHLRNLTVAKRDNRSEPFDRDKLARSLDIALRKRPVDPDRVEQMVSGIVRRLESSGESTVGSQAIGEIVMQSLIRIDMVAYIRFASVYKNFKDVKDFDTFVTQLRPSQEED